MKAAEGSVSPGRRERQPGLKAIAAQRDSAPPERSGETATSMPRAAAAETAQASYPFGRSTTLITPFSLSRNCLYISGASSRLAGWVMTKLGSIWPATIFSISGLV